MKASRTVGFQGGKSHGESELTRVMLREEPLRMFSALPWALYEEFYGKGNMLDFHTGGPDVASHADIL